MAQFKPKDNKTTADSDELLALRAELADVKARLEVAESAHSSLDKRVTALAATTTATTTAFAAERPKNDDVRLKLAHLEARVHAVAGAAATAASAAAAATAAATAASAAATATAQAGPDPDTEARLDALAERLASVDSLNERMGTIDLLSNQLAQLDARVNAQADLTDRVDALTERIATTDGLATRFSELAEQVAANDSNVRQAAEQIAVLEDRLDAVSSELLNQLSELGSDIDGLAAHTDEVAKGSVSSELIEAVRTAQVKLAAQQARYEIAFRADLAALAERVQRNTQ
jgi:chromosome segregation ATPase